MKKLTIGIIFWITLLGVLVYWAVQKSVEETTEKLNYPPKADQPRADTPTPQEQKPVLSSTSYRLFPDYTKTPGDVMTTDKKTMCTRGYAGSVRHVSEATKHRIFTMYGIKTPVQSGAWEIDHLVPLLNGGSNDEKNLWAEPAPEYHWKDRMELYIHSQICTGKLTVEEGQKLFTNDGWYKLYQQQKDFLGGDDIDVVR